MGLMGPWVISMGPPKSNDPAQGPKEDLGPVPWDGSLAGTRGPWGPIARSTQAVLRNAHSRRKLAHP
jgi:hypothetical protein